MKPCADCDIQYRPWQMDFDHKDPSLKSFNIGAECGNVGHKRLIEEIKKCEVVCANCHRDRWHKEKVR